MRLIEKGGGSDGCFTATLGIATLDGMGPVCYDLCSETERIGVSSLVPRSLLIAGIIQRLAKEAQLLAASRRTGVKNAGYRSRRTVSVDP